jgi:hypothetical protein
MRIPRSTSLLAMVATLASCEKRDANEPESAAGAATSAAPLSVSAPPSAPRAAQAAPVDAKATDEEPGNAQHAAVIACCRALSAEAEKSGPAQAKYTTAAAVCAGIARQVKQGSADQSAARSLIRAQLQGVALPGVC